MISGYELFKCRLKLHRQGDSFSADNSFVFELHAVGTDLSSSECDMSIEAQILLQIG